ncbi:MAG: Oligopeptide transport ATP-binding protein OppF [Chlamydiae bacterium]|nr:Oligopeptide transport ATP-binding protein OppF [Chlamydiota bacterium]
MPLLQVKNLFKTFYHARSKIEAVKDISFSIQKGSTLALIGESGSGKSTIARLLMRLIQPDAGSALFEGQDIFKMHKQELFHFRRDMQMIFQNPFSSLNPFMTVGQLLKEPFDIHQTLPKEKIPLEIAQLLDYVALPKNILNRYAHEFSGGQRQRIGIARALSLRPKCIICDEPISSLDVSIGAQILNLLKRLQEELNLTYLFIAHDLNMIKYIATHVAVMFKGQIVEIAPVQELFREPLHPYTQALLQASPIADPKIQRENLNKIDLQALEAIANFTFGPLEKINEEHFVAKQT